MQDSDEWPGQTVQLCASARWNAPRWHCYTSCINYSLRTTGQPKRPGYKCKYCHSLFVAGRLWLTASRVSIYSCSVRTFLTACLHCVVGRFPDQLSKILKLLQPGNIIRHAQCLWLTMAAAFNVQVCIQGLWPFISPPHGILLMRPMMWQGAHGSLLPQVSTFQQDLDVENVQCSKSRTRESAFGNRQ